MANTKTRPLWNTPPAFIAVLLVIIAFWLMLTSQASAAPLAGGTPTVSVGTIQVGVGGQGTAELVVSGVPAAGVGAWTVDVTYNSGIVSVADCTGLFGGVCNANVGPSLMRITGASGGGIFGTTSLATITFTCNALGTSVTGLNVSLLADANIGEPQEYAPIVINGSVACIDLPDTPTPVPPTDTPVRKSQLIRPFLANQPILLRHKNRRTRPSLVSPPTRPCQAKHPMTASQRRLPARPKQHLHQR